MQFNYYALTTLSSLAATARLSATSILRQVLLSFPPADEETKIWRN